MKQINYNVIGVMSGTSLDGIDLAYCSFTINKAKDNKKKLITNYKIVKATTLSYSQSWTNRLSTGHLLPANELELLNIDYTKYLATVILKFIAKHNINNLDAVCSHGHTILHQPHRGITLQIGNLPLLKTLLPYTVVCNFRAQDIALGGQGAPLVPIGDMLLFEQYDACINLGGFANISLAQNQQRIAYDICPVNIVLNHYAQKLGKAFDNEGAFAKAGTLIPQLLQELNAIDYYNLPPPKSLGKEWVEQKITPLINRHSQNAKDILHTFTKHTALQIAKQLPLNGTSLFTGGGSLNNYLIELIKDITTTAIIIPQKKILEYKEALIFGLLGVLKLEGKTNTLASVTGATRDHSAGVIYQ